jgi:hypothetical protein
MPLEIAVVVADTLDINITVTRSLEKIPSMLGYTGKQNRI